MKIAMSQRALVVSSVYTVLALLWITFSDQLLAVFITDPGLLTQAQTFKGWFFVGITALLLYFTLRNADRLATEADATEPPPGAGSSVRGRVIGLVVLTTLPLVVLTIYNGAEQQRVERADAQAQVLRFARLATARQERIIDSIREMLFTLTKLPAVQRADPTVCHRLFADLLPLSSRHALLGAALPDGTVFACAPPAAVTNNLSHRPWFRQAVQQAAFSVTEAKLTTAARELICAQPVYDAGNNLRAVVFASVHPDWVNRFAAELRLPESAVVTLVNRHGIITARSAAAAAYVGRPLPFAAQLTGRAGGTYEGPDVDDQQRIQAFLPTSPSAATDWVIVGFPSTLVTLDSNRTLLRNLVIIVLVALAAIAAASGMAELSIFRHLRELTAATRRLSVGNLTTRAKLRQAPRELGELARAFDDMAATLEHRTLERAQVEQVLRTTEAQLKAAIESLPFDFWMSDLESRFVMQNASSVKRWGQLIGKHPNETGLPADVVRAWQQSHRRALTGEVISREVTETRDNQTRHYRNIVAPIHVDGRLAGLLGVSIDNTDSRRAEETLRALTRRLRAVREEESTRIAREVHDELGQAMTALKFDLAWLTGQVTTPVWRDKLVTMTQLVDSALQTVRRIAAELRPGVLDNLGLIAAIEWQAQDFHRRTGITCHTNLPEAQLDVEPSRATTVFRILQEALTNVARHAHASEVGIALVRANGHVILEVSDNGIGLKTDPWQDAHSLGLLGMRERARGMNGEVSVKPGPVQGTVVTVSLPITDRPPHGELSL